MTGMMTSVTITIETHINPGRMSQLAASVFSVEQQVFGRQAYTRRELTQDLSQDRAILAIATAPSALIGFAYTTPLSYYEDDIFDLPKKYRRNIQKTAYLSNIAILPQYRRQHIATRMLTELTGEMRRQGFVYFETDALAATGLSALVRKIYGEKVLFCHSPVHSPWGEQEHFYILLNEPRAKTE